MPNLAMQPLPVNTVADPVQGPLAGHWFLEVGFGPCAGAVGRLFKTLEAARLWFGQLLGA